MTPQTRQVLVKHYIMARFAHWNADCGLFDLPQQLIVQVAKGIRTIACTSP
jgi:hypothetical protein